MRCEACATCPDCAALDLVEQSERLDLLRRVGELEAKVALLEPKRTPRRPPKAPIPLPPPVEPTPSLWRRLFG